tara:strand:+ start:2475 stop:2726 length:252 start_codon:yes stop_codon:yes gene_type:complete
MDNNITMEKTEKEVPSQQPEQQPEQQPQQQPQQPDISKLVIADENTALNVMVSFLHMAQKRGAFNIEESAKAWECIQMFMKRS